MVSPGSDLVFLNEICFEGIRQFRFGEQTVELEQTPYEKDTSGSIWPSAVRLADLVYSQKAVLQKSLAPDGHKLKVIELGCGATPLVSIACSLAGMDVTSTDLPDVIDRARSNLILSDQYHLTFAPFDWAKSLEGSNVGDTKFDLIVGADLLYNESLHVALVKTLHSILSNWCLPDAFALLCWQLRSREVEERFFRSVVQHGMAYAFFPRGKNDIVRENGPTEDHFRYTRVARIFLK